MVSSKHFYTDDEKENFLCLDQGCTHLKLRLTPRNLVFSLRLLLYDFFPVRLKTKSYFK